MPATNPDVLLEESKCMECIPLGLQLGVLINIFAKIAGVSTDPNTLMDGAKCMECIPMGLQLGVLIFLADQINQGGGGGGSGSSCLGRSVGAPVWVPAATCQAAVNFDDVGGMWWYDTASATWIQFA